MIAVFAAALLGAATRAQAEAYLLIEADSGKVLHAENATLPWYPASVTKLMTAYTTLRAVKEGRVHLDTLITVSPRAAAAQPTKMGFKPGTQVTIDNAIKMIMVKSANDMAVALAEGVGGSVEGFADMMNTNARRLGMTQTNYVNPNGLPDEAQVTSARDLAILARTLIREFPEHDHYWHISAIKMGKRVMRNYNALVDRYPGADGMKTGFVCMSGYNLVASATRDGRRLIAVVLGAYGGAVRAQKAAQLLERGFSANNLSWLRPSLGTVDALVPVANAQPINMKDQVCGKHRKRPASEDNDEEEEANTVAENAEAGENGEVPQRALSLSALKPAYTKYVLPPPVPVAPPVEVFVGLYKGASTADVAERKVKKTKAVATAKPDAAKPAAKKKEAAKPAEKKEKTAARPAEAKPAAAKPVDIKPKPIVSGTSTTDAAAKQKPKPQAAASKPQPQAQ